MSDELSREEEDILQFSVAELAERFAALRLDRDQLAAELKKLRARFDGLLNQFGDANEKIATLEADRDRWKEQATSTEPASIRDRGLELWSIETARAALKAFEESKAK